jgi:PAS domain S-box-containing protein
VASAIRDVTERRQTERAAAHCAAVVESSHDAIIGKDLEGIVTSWNHGAELLYGYTDAEMRGNSISLLVPPGHADDRAKILRRVRHGERIPEYETVRAR